LHLAARADQGFPYLRIHLTGQKDLYLAGEMLVARGPRGRLRVDPGTEPKKTSGYYASIVQDDEFVAAKEVRKIRK
jgi:hypothetical protein